MQYRLSDHALQPDYSISGKLKIRSNFSVQLIIYSFVPPALLLIPTGQYER